MAKFSKLSSVKRLILVGVVQDVPENYNNVKTILQELNIEALDFTVSADVKMCKFNRSYYISFPGLLVCAMCLVYYGGFKTTSLLFSPLPLLSLRAEKCMLI